MNVYKYKDEEECQKKKEFFFPRMNILYNIKEDFSFGPILVS